MVSFAPRSLYPQGRIIGTHCIRGWVGSRAGLDLAVGKREIPTAARNITPVFQPAAQSLTELHQLTHYTDSRVIVGHLVTRCLFFNEHLSGT